MLAEIDVKNTPQDINAGKYMVARVFDAELWYYGTYESEERAQNVAVEIGNGVVVKTVGGAG